MPPKKVGRGAMTYTSPAKDVKFLGPETVKKWGKRKEGWGGGGRGR